MKKSKKRIRMKKTGKIFFLTLFLVLALFACYFFLYDQSIRSIFIYGNNILTDQDVINIGELNDYPNFYTTSGGSIESKLSKNLYIKDVKVKKRFFHELHIYVTEYQALFYYNDTSKVVLENKEQVDNINNINLPIMINYVPDVKFEWFIDAFKDIDINIRNKISEIKYDPNEVDEDRFLLYMNDQNYVYITLTKMDYLNKYDETIPKLDGKKGILYLDSGNYFQIK